MLEPTACRFWQVALQSGLMDAQGLQACWDALPPEKRAPEAVDRRLARQAVQTGRLTLWQAQQLVAGRSSGYKIDRYVLLELIGQGGMGRVYLARDSRLNRRVAIKILSPERVGNPRAIARFHREAMVGAQLQHENLVRIYDEGESGGRCYLVMEYIEGRNIGQMIAADGPLPPPLAARLARQVALGLEHAQRKGLIHRDVNPYNILVTRDGVAKLTDLGLAIDLADQERVTRDGATVGTFDYVSPEQARHSHAVDTRSDIYSLGCTLYHMLAGRVPYPSASLPEKLFGHQAAEPEALTSLVPDIPIGLTAVVSRMMRKSPDERYATPLEVAQALEPFTDEMALGLASGDITPMVGTLSAAAAMAAAASRSTSSGTDMPRREYGLPGGGQAFPPSPASGSVPPSATSGSAPTPSPSPNPAATPPGSDLGLDLLRVDLGPEPSLTEGLRASRSRTKSSAERPKAEEPAEGGAPPGGRRKVVAAVALAVLLTVAAVVAAAALRGRLGTRGAGGGGGRSRSGTAGTAAGKAEPALPPPTGKEVRVVAADGTPTNERDFRTAVQAAVGGKGHVLLLNARPLKLSAADALNVGGGLLTIRAAEGVRPVLQVEVKGRKPFLATRADAPLRLEGVSILAHYAGGGPDRAPVIEAGASVSLERCDFRVEPEAQGRGPVAGSRAVVLEGGALTANGCFFQNFDRAVDVACHGGVNATLRQCMFVVDRTAAPAPDASTSSSASSDPGGWAVRLRGMPGGFGKAGRSLVLDHCTAQVGGLVNCVGFSTQHPLKVDVTSCAVLSDGLVAWETVSGPAAAPGRDALSWLGEGNLYDVRGKSWLAVGPKGGALRPLSGPDAPVSPESWGKAVGSERDPVAPPVRFATDPSALPSRPAPSDFAVADRAGVRPAGADPSQVGPVGRPGDVAEGP